ncbi:MAG: MFS transporter [Mycobacteriaceae bacterium]
MGVVVAERQVSAELDPRRWRALAVAITALFLTLLDLSIVNVALPSIRSGLGASTSQAQWVVSGYALAFGMVPIIGGRLGDDQGRRKMLLVGVAGFVVTSALVGLAPTPEVLVAGRLLQGLSGGLLNPQVAGLIQQLFPRHERGRAFGLLGTAVGVATATGPVVGGTIIGLGGQDWGWRYAFLLNVPVGITVLVLCRKWLPRDQPRAEPRPRGLDLFGAGLLALGLFGVLFPAVQFDSSRDLRLALILLPAAAVLVGFVIWERGPARRSGYPLIDLGLFSIRSYADGLGVALLYFAAFTGTPLVLSLFLQEGLGFSALHAGLVASSFAVGSAVSAPIGGRLVNRLGGRLLVGAIVVFMVGIVAAVLVVTTLAGQVDDSRLALVLAGPLVLAGLGGGSVITPNQALSLADVDSVGGSTAGGLLQTSQRAGSAFGAAVISAVFYVQATGAQDSRGPTRSVGYADAYAASLLVTIGLAAVALALAVRSVRRTPVG